MALTITQVGLNQAVNASELGVNLKITHVGLGTTGYEPTRNMTKLKREVLKVPITGGKNVSSNQVHLTALFDQSITITAREIGFYLENGTLFAVDSHPSDVLVYKKPSTKLIEAFDLILDAVPPNSITVDTSGDLNLYHAETFAVMATAQINNMRRSVRAFMRSSNFKYLTKDF